MDELQNPLLTFAKEALTLAGAEVEASPDQLSALLPEALRQKLRLPELVSLRTDATRALPGEQVLAYGSPLLDELVRLLGAAGRLAAITVELEYLKRSGFDEELARTVGFTNALVGVVRTSQQLVPYLLLTYRYQASSDEQRRGLLTVGLNARTLASVAGLEEALAHANKLERLPSAHLFSLAAPPEAVLGKGGRLALSAAKLALGPFVAAMERRRRNEAERLHAYHADLFREAHAKARRAKEDRKSSHESRAKAVAEDLAKKLTELAERYAVSLSVEPVAALLCVVPAVVAGVRVRRRAAETERAAVYNPLTKAFDPFVCDACEEDTTSLTACDEQVHLTCAACNRSCPSCKKASCRACSKERCPRCGKSRE
jgi:hypothetical protein